MADSSDDYSSADEEEEAAADLLATAVSDGDEGGEEEGDAGPSGDRPPVYRADEMHEKLEDIMREELGWEETLVVAGISDEQAAFPVADVDDDLERELSFYNQALGAARQAAGRLEAAGTKWQRPVDYYAEMVKSDEHMARVKEQLMFEQRQIEQAQERRKQREQKRFSKEVQAERKKERAQSKKSNITSVTKLRKQRDKSGYAGELDMDAELMAMERGKAQGPGERIRPGDKRSKKREARDERYGFGGRKRLKKQNDATSAANMEGYKPGRFNDSFGAGGGGGGGGGGKKFGGRGGKFSGGKSPVGKKFGGRGGTGQQGKKNRPGKARRAAGRR